MSAAVLVDGVVVSPDETDPALALSAKGASAPERHSDVIPIRLDASGAPNPRCVGAAA